MISPSLFVANHKSPKPLTVGSSSPTVMVAPPALAIIHSSKLSVISGVSTPVTVKLSESETPVSLLSKSYAARRMVISAPTSNCKGIEPAPENGLPTTFHVEPSRYSINTAPAPEVPPETYVPSHDTVRIPKPVVKTGSLGALVATAGEAPVTLKPGLSDRSPQALTIERARTRTRRVTPEGEVNWRELVEVLT